MILPRKLQRLWRRCTAAGTDEILDYEVAVLQVALRSLPPVDRTRLLAQLARYDRIDRAPNKRHQRFIDDDSNFLRTDWPEGILFKGSGIVHCADVVVRHEAMSAAKVEAKLFLLNGRLDGCEFERSHTKGVDIQSLKVSTVVRDVLSIRTCWMPENTKLYAPFTQEQSSYQVVPA